MVVNGSCESDWQSVLDLARKYPVVLPSFGYHPWYIKERTSKWQETLVRFLDSFPSSVAIGEIGLDRWIENFDLPQQEEVFLFQLHSAAERNCAVSIHCLKAWGRLFELLRDNPRPPRGFMLHSFGGPEEMITPLAKLGAYFSFPGYYAQERKAKHQETFKQIPPNRLLIETDAPDQLPPDSCRPYPLIDAASGKPINHPANLRAIYEFVARLRQISIEDLAIQVEKNFRAIFG